MGEISWNIEKHEGKKSSIENAFILINRDCLRESISTSLQRVALMPNYGSIQSRYLSALFKWSAFKSHSKPDRVTKRLPFEMRSLI